MRIHALTGLMWMVACRADSAPPPAPRATQTAVKLAPPDAAPADARGVDARLQITTSPPPELHCPPPRPAVEAELTRKILHEQAGSPATPTQITPICEEQEGWLVSEVFPADAAGVSPSRSPKGDGEPIQVLWLVKDRARPVRLENWIAGPIYDFDGDGTPEASTLAGSELKIWFDRGRKPSYSLLASHDPGDSVSPWAALDHQVVWLEQDGHRGVHVFEFHPGQAHHELPPATCVQVAGSDAGCASQPDPPGQDPPVQNETALQLARILTRRASAARCVPPDDASRAQHEPIIEQAVLREIDDHMQPPAVGPLRFTWGCTSHGETPVVVDVDQSNSGWGSELWSARGDKAMRRRSYWSSPPDEWTSTYRIAIGDHGDFDGDGFDESIVEEHFDHPGGYVRFTVHLGGADVVVPSHLVVRAADGKRDGIVRLRPFAVPAPVVGRCKPTVPGECLPGPPPAGWLPTDPAGSWDWEHQAPQVLVWRGARFAPLPDAAVAAIAAETTAERAPVK